MDMENYVSQSLLETSITKYFNQFDHPDGTYTLITSIYDESLNLGYDYLKITITVADGELTAITPSKTTLIGDLSSPIIVSSITYKAS